MPLNHFRAWIAYGAVALSAMCFMSACSKASNTRESEIVQLNTDPAKLLIPYVISNKTSPTLVMFVQCNATSDLCYFTPTERDEDNGFGRVQIHTENWPENQQVRLRVYAGASIAKVDLAQDEDNGLDTWRLSATPCIPNGRKCPERMLDIEKLVPVLSDLYSQLPDGIADLDFQLQVQLDEAGQSGFWDPRVIIKPPM